MINQKIIDKINDKCKDNEILKEFIMEVLDNEDAGKQYNKAYTGFMKHALKEIKNDEI